jgi:hypothetical protein
MIPTRVVALALTTVFTVASAAADDPPADLDTGSEVVVLRGTSVGGPIPPPRPARQETRESTAIAAPPQVIVLWSPIWLDRPVVYPSWSFLDWGPGRRHARVGRFLKRRHNGFAGVFPAHSGKWTTRRGSSRQPRSEVRWSH